MFKRFVESMLGNRPFQPLFEGEGAQGGGGGEGGDGGNPGDGGSNPGEGGNGGEGNQGGKVEFTAEQQKFINNLINKTIGEERTKAEAARQKELERQKMDDAQKAQADLKDAQDKIKAQHAKTLSYEIKDAAREAGVPSKKLERFLKVVDADGMMDEDGNIDTAKVKQAVDAVLGDMPEFKASDANKGPGEFNGGGESVKYSMAQINAMTPREVAANYDEVMASISFHQKQK